MPMNGQRLENHYLPFLTRLRFTCTNAHPTPCPDTSSLPGMTLAGSSTVCKVNLLSVVIEKLWL
jgi:hypothetical protein